MARSTLENAAFALAERVDRERSVGEKRITGKGQINEKKLNDMTAAS
jgi:hypothetical protein